MFKYELNVNGWFKQHDFIFKLTPSFVLQNWGICFAWISAYLEDDVSLTLNKYKVIEII